MSESMEIEQGDVGEIIPDAEVEIIDAPEPTEEDIANTPYDGSPHFTEQNIAAAKASVQQAVIDQVNGFNEAVYLGTMTEEEVKEQFDAGVYGYVFLQDPEDSQKYMCIYQVHGEPVGSKMLTRTEIRTWHPYHNPENVV